MAIVAFRFQLRIRVSILSSSIMLLFLSSMAAAGESEVASHPAKLQLPPGELIDRSPGAKPGEMMACSRVYFRGVRRLKNLGKYAHSVRVRVGFAPEELTFRLPVFEVCFHRNASIGVGMCSVEEWQRVTKGNWTTSISFYDNRILDVRTSQSLSPKVIEISTEEELMYHRVFFLVVGIVMMLLARHLSESLYFYYGSSMTVGVIVVVLIVLYQGMKLLPTGRRSSLAIFMYSSVVGGATFLLQYLSGLLRSLLVEIGISEDMHNPLAILFFGILGIIGAWLGFWSVRKLVLDEEGLVDKGVAFFVKCTFWIVAVILIFLSSLDTLFASEAVILGIMISVILSTRWKLKWIRRLCRRTWRWLRKLGQVSNFGHSDADFLFQNHDGEFESPMTPTDPFAFAPSTYVKGAAGQFSPTGRTPPKKSLEGVYLSTFHNTPERRRFSKEEWNAFTKETTNKAMKELVSSPDFNHWAAANVDRISVTPPSGRSNLNRRRRFYFF